MDTGYISYPRNAKKLRDMADEELIKLVTSSVFMYYDQDFCYKAAVELARRLHGKRMLVP